MAGRSFKKRWPFIFLIVVLCVWISGSAQARSPQNFPANAEQALKSATEVTLYSLEPDVDRVQGEGGFYTYKVLGKVDLTNQAAHTTASAFFNAVNNSNGTTALCFEPRHGLRINYHAHTFDFLLCYQCMGMIVFEDGVQIGVYAATGSPEVLNDILRQANIPLPHIESEEYKKEQAQKWQKQKDDTDRWMAAMPDPIRAVWSRKFEEPLADISSLRPILESNFSNRGDQIMILLSWYGSGAGPWSGFPAYEEVPERLLFDYSTQEIIETIMKTSAPTEAQLNGASRFFADWDFSQKRKGEINLLPPQLKETLLNQAVKSGNADNILRAKKAYSNN